MKITSINTELDEIVFLLLQPSVVRSISAHTPYMGASVVPENCKAVVACHVFRPGEAGAPDVYIKGFAFCAGEDQFCAVKGMKLALEDAARQFRKLGLESPWKHAIESRLKPMFIGEVNSVNDFNEDVRKRLEFDPYKVDLGRPRIRDWSKRKRVVHVQV